MDRSGSAAAPQKSQTWRSVRVIIAAVFVVLGFWLLLPFVACVASDAASSGIIGARKKFESDEWKRNDKTVFVRPVRFRMYPDLVSSRALIGRTKDEVEALLGPADGPPRHPERLSYFLRPAFSDGCWLLIYFEDGVVSEVKAGGDCDW